MTRVEGEAHRHGFAVVRGEDPFRLEIRVWTAGDRIAKFRYSIYCNGFEPKIDVLKLTKTGKPYPHSRERPYARVGGLMRYLDSEWKKFMKDMGCR